MLTAPVRIYTPNSIFIPNNTIIAEKLNENKVATLFCNKCIQNARSIISLSSIDF